MFNRTRFALARKRRGLTKRALAERVGVTERSISAYENGTTQPEKETVSKLAKALSFPETFFFADDVDELTPDVASFRAMTKMTAAQRDMALSAGTIALMLNDWLEERFSLPSPDIPDLGRLAATKSCADELLVHSSEGDDFPLHGREHDPEACAEALRMYWGLGELPVKNMITLLEAHGIRVYSLTIDAREVDAFSMWYDGKPFVFLNTNKTAERCRFDAAHELGHLVMHRHGVPHGQEAEREANAFASAFLMPRRSVLANAPRSATLPSLIAHKKYWTVSAAALNYRLHVLGLTTVWTYRTLCIQLSEFGRNQEPDGATFETSQVLSKVFAALRAEGVSKFDVAKAINIAPEDIDELVFGLMINVLQGGKRDGMPSQPSKAKLRLVQ
ncbi:MAG: ImmA/IrrE family metallo-endopeptidase [Azoarcus sp.]|jgi:Zn-dependent peptidase ImmA (M78 family)/transcriptional regulator with XRE-family HTH domain|nr:ImmA/IrrE family metallo-endopeptidase [Azoarcus sp.]